MDELGELEDVLLELVGTLEDSDELEEMLVVVGLLDDSVEMDELDEVEEGTAEDKVEEGALELDVEEVEISDDEVELVELEELGKATDVDEVEGSSDVLEVDVELGSTEVEDVLTGRLDVLVGTKLDDDVRVTIVLDFVEECVLDFFDVLVHVRTEQALEISEVSPKQAMRNSGFSISSMSSKSMSSVSTASPQTEQNGIA